MTTLPSYYCAHLLTLIIMLSSRLPVSANLQVNALLAMKHAFHNSSDILINWEPSLSPCQWLGVKCGKDKVTSLELSGHHLSGTLSPEIGKLSSLLYLNLSRNKLTGEIPVEIGHLRELKVLDLHSNMFVGRIPESIIELRLRKLNLSYNRLTGALPAGLLAEKDSLKGNPGLCTSNRCSGVEAHSLSTAMLAVMLSVLVLLCFFAVVGSVRWYKRTHSFSELASSKFDHNVAYECPADYTIEELKLATAEFDEANIVGQGINGVVFRGRSNAGYDVAIKQLINVDLKVDFQRELELLSRARHKNVAGLLGYCDTRTEKFLVSEYVPCLNLSAWLSGQRRKDFDWEKRKTVLLGVAKALAYLHSPTLEIVHGSLKPSNILVEDDFTPKLTDHGLHNLLQEVSTRDVRNAAYEPPEASTSQATFKSDSYGFGVLLVQMVTGQPAWLLLETVKASGVKLREWVLLACENEEFVDEDLRKPPMWEVKKVTQLATMCLELLPVLRPRMDEVVQFLVEEMLISNKSSELDGLFIELVMDSGGSRTENLLPSGSSSSHIK